MKRKLKKSLSVILAALMMICSVPLAGLSNIDLPDFGALFASKAEAATSGKCGENLTWTFDEETGEIVITGTGVMYNYDTFNNCSPWYRSTNINIVKIDKGVESIGDYAFYNCDYLRSIEIPASVTIIGDSAFYCCSSLANLKIPNSVTNINSDAFYGCANLTSIKIPNSVKYIGNAAFAGTSIINLTIPDNVTHLGPASFTHCTKLKSVKIGKGITDIHAFSECNSLKTVIIPETVKSIGFMAFYNCSNIENVYYGGSESEWKQIEIDELNENLTSAKLHFNTSGPVSNLTNNDTPKIPDYDSSAVDVSTVKTPSTSTISYGDSIILHVDPAKIPSGGYVEWYSSNGNFSGSVSTDGTSCTISPSKSGDTTFTSLIYDEEGNIVSVDEQTMTSKAGFFQKIIAFFKGLFGLNKTIPNVFVF